jgi:hypothetical protein
MNGAAATEAEALASGSAPATDQPLQLSIRLGRQLEEAGIAYCHWKSNAANDRSISGENDIDLLVEAAQARPFTELLSGLGFVRAYRPGQEVPGIESFYGFDAQADRLVHVHAHYKLVVGDDRTKNYRLPIEVSYIGSARPGTVFRLPAAEFEYVALVIRPSSSTAHGTRSSGVRSGGSAPDRRAVSARSSQTCPRVQTPGACTRFSKIACPVSNLVCFRIASRH